MTLRDFMREPFLHQCRKHDLADDCECYADRLINQMSHSEFLAGLSDALEEWKTHNEL